MKRLDGKVLLVAGGGADGPPNKGEEVGDRQWPGNRAGMCARGRARDGHRSFTGLGAGDRGCHSRRRRRGRRPGSRCLRRGGMQSGSYANRGPVR